MHSRDTFFREICQSAVVMSCYDHEQYFDAYKIILFPCLCFTVCVYIGCVTAVIMSCYGS